MVKPDSDPRGRVGEKLCLWMMQPWELAAEGLHALVGKGTPKPHHPPREGILSLVRSFREQEGKGQNTSDGRCVGIWADP